MPEYFVKTNSFAAPFVSDRSSRFVTADTPEEAMDIVIQEYSHPCGLYSAYLYTDANAEAKDQKALVKWHSEKCAKDMGRR
jgi:hypothetical protein